MIETIDSLLHDLANKPMADFEVIDWAAPVPYFGELASARIATLGINPSNREFLTPEGAEIDGSFRRFETLNSLGISEWSSAKEADVLKILDSCDRYFARNPYTAWFNKLETILAGTGASYYSGEHRACHLDLVPFATMIKWSSIPAESRRYLLHAFGPILGNAIRCSLIGTLVLNGSAVVRTLASLCKMEFRAAPMIAWDLQRVAGKSRVQGFAFEGKIRKIGMVDLGREVNVLGFNHNIQSSFGVTSKVIQNIHGWIRERVQL
jgi:hypothetical protein